MRDKVFIVWSGSSVVAKKVEDLLRSPQYGYDPYSGGNMENDSLFISIGDTVINQMKKCNQAIVIFEKKKDGSVSNNLFFELGYVLSRYGTRKVHCVMRESDDIDIPSDFDSCFVQKIACSNDEEFVQGIVEYFVNRQKMSITENKMSLINNRYIIHDKLVAHYSPNGSQCSDYELAQYVLFYTQACYMFGDGKTIIQELETLNRDHSNEFSDELRIAVDISLNFLKLVEKIPSEGVAYLDESECLETFAYYDSLERSANFYTNDIFYRWARVYAYQHRTFFSMICGNDDDGLDTEDRIYYYNDTIKYARLALKAIDELEESTKRWENNDSNGIFSLFRAYLHRNMYVAISFIDANDPDESKAIAEEGDNALERLKMTTIERHQLKQFFSNGNIDTKLYDNFCMEYYLALKDFLDSDLSKLLDRQTIRRCKKEIGAYLDRERGQRVQNIYLQQIEAWYNANK